MRMRKPQLLCVCLMGLASAANAQDDGDHLITNGLGQSYFAPDPYQERVLAHLRATLTLPVPATTTPTQQEAVPEGTLEDALLSGLYSLPFRYQPYSHWWHRPAATWAGTDHGFSFFFPGEATIFTPEVIAAYEQQLFEELYQMICSLWEQGLSPATEAQDP